MKTSLPVKMRRRSSRGSRAMPVRTRSPYSESPSLLVQEFESASNPSRPMRPSPLGASTMSGMPLDMVDRIRAFPFFSSAPDSFLAAIGVHMRLQAYSAQETIVNEGDDAKAMYWLIRGTVVVTSRDRESVYAELQPGSFFGEIGIMMDIPRTASVVARYKSLVVRLNKDDLQKELPNYPDVERAIREEAAERLAILERKKQKPQPPGWTRKRSRDLLDTDVQLDEPDNEDGTLHKKRKSPSPALLEAAAGSALSTGAIHVRQLLRELPLFSNLPNDILHFLGLNAQLQSFEPFTTIMQQGSLGRDVYFITEGEVEVYTTGSSGPKARLKTGNYFGEVTSLSLAPKRTATVRSVTSIECLVISGEILDELWERCSPDLRKQVERTAKERLEGNSLADVAMTDASNGTLPIDELEIDDDDDEHTRPKAEKKPPSPSNAGQDVHFQTTNPFKTTKIEPFDPDPFQSTERLTRRPNTTRRGSLPNVPADASPLAEGESQGQQQQLLKPPRDVKFGGGPGTRSGTTTPNKRPQNIRRQASEYSKGVLPSSVLVRIFQKLDIYHLLRLRAVSVHWSRLLSSSPEILHELDLSAYNRCTTDAALVEVICPFVGNRPREININNCFHMTDEGFSALATHCSANLRVLRMKSVWDISPQAVVDMANKARDLEEIDFSNCRKVSDNLLSRIIGWVVRRSQAQVSPNAPPEGTVIGCPSLRRLTLSYCKHVSDRFMAHLAFHAADRLEQVDFTRCTTITDVGFRQWGERSFPVLRKLVLADCTYLTDHAIQSLVHTAKALEELDLSFCCALSDAAVEALSSGCKSLQRLNLGFCGSAVSDSSMQSLASSLYNLRDLSVRGCVRVTATGVEAILQGCEMLEAFDVSQCRNLKPWIDGGGIQRTGGKVKFSLVAEGRWRMSGD